MPLKKTVQYRGVEIEIFESTGFNYSDKEGTPPRYRVTNGGEILWAAKSRCGYSYATDLDVALQGAHRLIDRSFS
jgi:hypothetical protein